MSLTYNQMLQGIRIMRQEGVVLNGMSLAVCFLDKGWWYPHRFYYRDGKTTINAMLYGPIYHNDNNIEFDWS